MKFNLIITGIGGQGILTFGSIISEAALLEGYEVKTAELHGLSQRGGHTEMHVRFGERIYSPLVRQGNADLIISLELLESLRACYYASKEKTKFLINNYKIPPLSVYLEKTSYPEIEEIKEILKNFSLKFEIVDTQKVVKNLVLSNVYLLGYAIKNGYLPLKKENAWDAIVKVIGVKKPEAIEINKKAFEKAFE